MSEAPVARTPPKHIAHQKETERFLAWGRLTLLAAGWEGMAQAHDDLGTPEVAEAYRFCAQSLRTQLEEIENGSS